MRRGAVLLAALAACSAALADPVLVESGSDSARAVRASFLLRGIGARPVALGGAYTAAADEAAAVWWNPGALGRARGLSAMATHEIGGFDSSVSAVSAAYPVGPGAAGIGVVMASYGDYEVRDEYGEQTGTDSLSDLGVCAAYGAFRPFGLPGSWGVGAEFVSEGAGGSLVAGMAGGVVPVTKGVVAGLSLRHLGPAVDGFRLPSVVSAGAGWRFIPAAVGALDAVYRPSDGRLNLSVGAEYMPAKFLSLRAGYLLRTSDPGYEGLAGVTAGLGFRLGGIGIDYAFQPYGSLYTSHRMSVVYGASRAK